MTRHTYYSGFIQVKAYDPSTHSPYPVIRMTHLQAYIGHIWLCLLNILHKENLLLVNNLKMKSSFGSPKGTLAFQKCIWNVIEFPVAE